MMQSSAYRKQEMSKLQWEGIDINLKIIIGANRRKVTSDLEKTVNINNID